MKYKIVATSVAKKETEDAVFYYESVSRGLGLEFLKIIENKYRSISRNPFANGFIDNKNVIRDVRVKRFPFVIIYKIEAKTVIILSVHHTHKEPEY